MEILHAGKVLRIMHLIALLSIVLYGRAQDELVRSDENAYNIVELQTEDLPPLNIARTGHASLLVNGELVVFGGHTNGFVPTATAEYFRDGAWHVIPMVYPHDHAIAMLLRSGKVFLAGGHKENLGIGQLFSTELYDPETHTCQGFGCMANKRAFANAIEMGDGQVIISGNWYEDDAIEMFDNVYDPMCTNAVKLKDVSYNRAIPYILRISDNDAIIFSSSDYKSEPSDPSIIDRLNGDSYCEPFLLTWCPLRTPTSQRSYTQFIGDETTGRYEWLLPVENDSTGQVAIARVVGPTDDITKASFSLLQTTQPLPDSIRGKKILYSSLICDREREIAYLIGEDEQARIYVVAIQYDSSEPLQLTIYVTQPQPIGAQSVTPILTPEGDLVFTGGHLLSNFYPSNAVIRLPLGQYRDTKAFDVSNVNPITVNHGQWIWIVITGIVLCIILAIFISRRKGIAARQRTVINTVPTIDKADTDISGNTDIIKNPNINEDEIDSITDTDIFNDDDDIIEDMDIIEDKAIDKNLPKDEFLADLYKRIEQLMEEEKLFLNPNLRATDVAVRLKTNTSYVSAAVNTQRGCSFSQFLAIYRISYAQDILRQQPDTKISTICSLSGFSTDSTFFRAFRAITGMSPKEWISEIRDT